MYVNSNPCFHFVQWLTQDPSLRAQAMLQANALVRGYVSASQQQLLGFDFPIEEEGGVTNGGGFSGSSFLGASMGVTGAAGAGGSPLLAAKLLLVGGDARNGTKLPPFLPLDSFEVIKSHDQVRRSHAQSSAVSCTPL